VYQEPKYHKYFGDVIQPLISKKSGRSLEKSTIFSETWGHACILSSFWVYLSEATILLHNHHFYPTILYHPQVFLWLPHFFVEKLHCPSCKCSVLEKNALVPHRIVNMDHCFYIISWAYYCQILLSWLESVTYQVSSGLVAARFSGSSFIPEWTLT
jgi:hypothetical protein